jgi:hypothetical protein
MYCVAFLLLPFSTTDILRPFILLPFSVTDVLRPYVFLPFSTTDILRSSSLLLQLYKKKRKQFSACLFLVI